MSKELVGIIKRKMDKEQIREFVDALIEHAGSNNLMDKIDGKTLLSVLQEDVRMLISYKYKHLFTDEELQMVVKCEFKK